MPRSRGHIQDEVHFAAAHFLVRAEHVNMRGFRPVCKPLSIRLMDKILHDPKDPKLWELWYIPYNG